MTAPSKGTLYIVATPIGNLEDITLRALRILRAVDLIACEDTRHTRKLLTHFEIPTPTISYHEHNERTRAEELIQKLEAGRNIALVSDAGTPLVSDPGFRIVEYAISRGVNVVPVPGSSALVAALCASGLPTDEFHFAGFLPSKKSARKKRLGEHASQTTTLIFYEAPYRIRESLADILEVMGNRPVVIARELTKLHEEILRGLISDLLSSPSILEPRGEFVIILGPRKEHVEDGSPEFPSSIMEEIETLMQEKAVDHSTALKMAARRRGLSRGEAYRLAVEEKNRQLEDEDQ